MKRNKRCLLAYHFKRLDKIRDLRWEIGPVVPEVSVIIRKNIDPENDLEKDH